MKSFAFDALSPEAVRRRLDVVDLAEKQALAEALSLIALMDARGDYLEAGYSCMQKYCMGRLGMSEDRAGKRITVARAGRRFVGVFERLADGRLSVSAALVLAPRLCEANAEALLALAERRSRGEVLRLLAERDHAAKALATQAPAPSNPPSPASGDESPAVSRPDLLGPDTPVTESAPGRMKTHIRGRVFETETGAHGIRVELTEEEFADFAKARDLLAHVVRNGDAAEVIARALRHYAAHLEKKQYGAKPGSPELKRVPKGRHIPKALRRFIADRDGRCCSFVSPDGHRCCETRALQVDHIVPRSQGGETKAENLRLLCAHHNRHEAAKRIGEEKIAAVREQHERAVAEQKKAKEEEADRALARRESDADLMSALRGLGMTREQAEIAIERTTHLALGKIEDRVLAALKERGKGLAA
ncbi:MAG: HNH endonuclease signature motif containing protein [Candidatus Eisenbacteria bacterium]